MSQEMLDDFKRINEIIFGQGLALGSEDYFTVRNICCKHLKAKAMPVVHAIKCPICHSDDYIQIDHEGDMLAPEATYFVCNDCGYATEPE